MENTGDETEQVGDIMVDYMYDYNYYECHDSNFTEEYAADVIYIYISPILLFLGSFGNLLSLVIMYRFSFRVLSTCIYFCLLSVVDLLVLYTRCGNEWLTIITQLDLSDMLMRSSESVCKVLPFVINFIFHLSKWLMVCVAVEGFIATRYPEKADKMCNLSRAKAIVLFLTVVLVCVNIHYFWSFELIFIKEMQELGDSNAWFCTFAKNDHYQSELFHMDIWPIVDLIIAEVFPSSVVIICGAVMLVQIIKGKHRGDQRHQKWKQRYQLHASAMDELQITILMVCIFFLVLTLPKVIYHDIFTYVVNKYLNLEDTCHFRAQQMLATAICAALEHLFLGGKFILYFTTSSQFRTECKNLCLGCFKCINIIERQVVHPNRSASKPLSRDPVPATSSVYRASIAESG